MTHNRRDESNWIITASLAILAAVALALALIYTRAVMIPFVVALFIVALVAPIEDFQVKWLRLPRVIAVVTTLLVVLSILAAASLGVAQAARTITSTAREYSESFGKMATRLVDAVEHLYPQEPPAPPVDANGPKPAPVAAANDVPPVEPEPEAFALFPVVTDSTAPASVEVRPWWDPLAREPNDAQVVVAGVPPATPAANPWPIDTRQLVRDLKNYLFYVLTNAVGTIFGLISGMFFVSVFLIFLLAGRNPYAVHSPMYRAVVQKIRRYVGIHMVISLITAVLVWQTLDRLGLKLAGVFGILAFVLNWIPSIGSVITTLLPIPIAVVQFQSSPVLIVLVVAIPGAIQNLLGNILEPKLMGEGLDLHPVTILLSLAFWGLLWGIVGMFVAAPITAALRVVLMQFDTFRPLGNLLAGDFSGKARSSDVTAQAGGKVPPPAPRHPSPRATHPAGSESADSLPG